MKTCVSCKLDKKYGKPGKRRRLRPSVDAVVEFNKRKKRSLTRSEEIYLFVYKPLGNFQFKKGATNIKKINCSYRWGREPHDIKYNLMPGERTSCKCAFSKVHEVHGHGDIAFARINPCTAAFPKTVHAIRASRQSKHFVLLERQYIPTFLYILKNILFKLLNL